MCPSRDDVTVIHNCIRANSLAQVHVHNALWRRLYSHVSKHGQQCIIVKVVQVSIWTEARCSLHAYEVRRGSDIIWRRGGMELRDEGVKKPYCCFLLAGLDHACVRWTLLRGWPCFGRLALKLKRQIVTTLPAKREREREREGGT